MSAAGIREITVEEPQQYQGPPMSGYVTYPSPPPAVMFAPGPQEHINPAVQQRRLRSVSTAAGPRSETADGQVVGGGFLE